MNTQIQTAKHSCKRLKRLQENLFSLYIPTVELAIIVTYYSYLIPSVSHTLLLIHKKLWKYSPSNVSPRDFKNHNGGLAPLAYRMHFIATVCVTKHAALFSVIASALPLFTL